VADSNDNPSSGGADLDKISNQIEKARLEFTERLDDLQNQLSALKTTVDNKDTEINTRFNRITHLISSTMDHIQMIVQTVVEMHNRLTECEEQNIRYGKSLAVNKKNIADLNKYVKQVDALWKDARKELDALNAEADAQKKFRWKLTAAISSVLSAATYFGAGWIKKIWTTFFPGA